MTGATANYTLIYLSPNDAELFKEFQKRYDIIQSMENTGIFNIRYGKAIFNFAEGVLQNIVKEEIVYHK